MSVIKLNKYAGSNNYRKKLHIKWKQIFMVILLSLSIVSGLLFIFNSTLSSTAIANVNEESNFLESAENIEELKYSNKNDYKEITVVKGQSLWELAEIYSSTDEDPRNFIHEVRQLNDLETAQITVGEQLKIPNY